VQAPDTVYVGDLTYLPTGEGWLYLASVLALCSRAAGLLMHTDRGRQDGADSYRQLLAQHGMEPRMSRKGNCWDNAVAESCFHT
jgi:transposase InsO family protein